MNNILSIASSTALSCGILANGSLPGYLSNSVIRRLGFTADQVNTPVQYAAPRRENIIVRALKQAAFQEAYGQLRSYPRYMRYYERQLREKKLSTSNTAYNANDTDNNIYKLIEDQKSRASSTVYSDSIAGNVVDDFLELKINDGQETTFVDLQPLVGVSGKNNVVLTVVQGRDYSRKEFVSGGDLMIKISGKIVHRHPDLYPEADVSKLLKIVQYKGVVGCSNTLLRQYNISQLIILDHNLEQISGFRNVQPYSLSCVAVEPDKTVEVVLAAQDAAETQIEAVTGWKKLLQDTKNTAIKNADPSELLKLSQTWL